MNAQDRGTNLWGMLAIVCAAAIEWLLVEVAVKDTRLDGHSGFVWFFPLGLMPALTAMSVVLLGRTKSARQEAMIFKYLVIYLPCIGIPLAVQAFGGMRAETVAWLVALPAQILIPFWLSGRIQKLAGEEAGAAGA
jgi:hypothetical protein